MYTQNFRIFKGMLENIGFQNGSDKDVNIELFTLVSQCIMQYQTFWIYLSMKYVTYFDIFAVYVI